MPIVPKYTKQVFVETPNVRTEASSSARPEKAYENNLTRLGQILPAAVSVGLSALGKKGSGRDGSRHESGGTDLEPYAQNAVLAREEADESLRLRGEMMSAARNEIKQTGALKTASLESFAGKRFTAQTASGPAGNDYAVLQAAARDARRESQTAALQSSVQTEESLVRRVGSLVRSPEALGEYLSAQLPAYEARLARAGLKEEEVQTRAQNVRAKTVQENVSRALAAGDWRAASATLEKHGSALPQDVKRVCADRTRASFAQSRGEKLWREASLKTSGGPAEILRAAEANLQEPDAELKTLIREELGSLSRRAELEKNRASADALETLAGLDASSARAFWAASEALAGEEDGLIGLAVRRLDTESVRPDAETFVNLYFRQNGRDNDRAFKRGDISSCDFLRLEAVRRRGLGGAFSPEAELTVRAADVWMQKKGFSTRDVSLAQYALLTAQGGPAAAWKEIKNYLEV